MIIETLCVLAGVIAKPVYDRYVEPIVDKEKSAIRLRCQATLLEGFAALSKARKEAKEAKEQAKATVKAAKAAKPALAGA